MSTYTDGNINHEGLFAPGTTYTITVVDGNGVEKMHTGTFEAPVDVPTDFSGVSYTVEDSRHGKVVRPTGTVDTQDGDIIEYIIVNGGRVGGTDYMINAETYTFSGGGVYPGETMSNVQIKLQGKEELETIPEF